MPTSPQSMRRLRLTRGPCPRHACIDLTPAFCMTVRRAIERKASTTASTNGRSLMLAAHPLDAALAGRAHGLLDRLEQRVVGLGIMERLARRVEHRRRRLPAAGSAPAVHPIEPLADPVADRAVLVARGAHQRHVRIVNDEIAVAELLRHGVARAEIDHVERAGRADIGKAGADGGAEAILGRRRRRRRPACRRPRSWSRRRSPRAGRNRRALSIDRPPMPVAWKTRQS